VIDSISFFTDGIAKHTFYGHGYQSNQEQPSSPVEHQPKRRQRLTPCRGPSYEEMQENLKTQPDAEQRCWEPIYQWLTFALHTT